jgi:hypothetical protein
MHRERTGDLRLRAPDVSAEAQAFVALAMRLKVHRDRIAVIVAALAERRVRNLGHLAIQTMTRPMAAPARNGLRDHQSDHQFGNQCLHNCERFYPIITVIGRPGNAPCEKPGVPLVAKSATRRIILARGLRNLH